MQLSRILLTCGGFFSFFIFGFVDNLKGPLLPEMVRDDQLSYSQVGTIFFAGYIGFIISTLLCGYLADQIRHRRILLLASLCLLVGGLGYSASGIYPLLIASMSIIGLGLGAIELGGNGLMVELHSETRGRYLNLLGTFHGLGSLTVPLIAAWLLRLEYSWQWIYGASACLAIPLAILFWPSQRGSGSPSVNSASNVSIAEQGDTSSRHKAILKRAFTLQMWLYYLIISSYVALELGVAAWMIEFLQHDRGFTSESSSYLLSAFFVLLMVGRLFGAFIVDAVGHHRSVAIALIGSCLCLAVGIFVHPSLVYLIPLSGLFMSIVFPTVTASVSATHQENIGSILGILFSFSGFGGAVGPWTVGVVSDWAGLELGIASTIAFGLISLAALAGLNGCRSRV